jgi:hypothetical protein
MLVKVQEAEGGIVSDIAVDEARADAPLLVPSVERHQELFGRPPSTVATDRGFHSGRGERRLVEMGVTHPVLPRPGSLYRLGRHRQQPGSDREAPRPPPLILTFSPQAGRRDRNGCVELRIPTPALQQRCYSLPFCTAV